jgi:maltooligosyltrehalose trehalohydrolase
MKPTRRPGALLRSDGCEFLVWAPHAQKVEALNLSGTGVSFPLTPIESGYFLGRSAKFRAGDTYFLRLDGHELIPDPASVFQPEGISGPSEIQGENFAWEDAHWKNLPLRDFIFSEIHVGTYTAEGTFEAILPHLDELVELGITALQLMPVAQFEGTHSWGFEGVFPYAVQDSYGGPLGLKKLVNECHKRGLAVTLDVVYSHLGTQGCVLPKFGPYLSTQNQTSSGKNLNFCDNESDAVRHFFLQNALYFCRNFHLDGLRISFDHSIYDSSVLPFLEELAGALEEESYFQERKIYLFAGGENNDPRLVWRKESGGWGFGAQGSVDFQRCMQTLLTGKCEAGLEDYKDPALLLCCLKEGYAYQGQYSASHRRSWGRPPQSAKDEQFIVFTENHSSLRNRPQGDRQSVRIDAEKLKVASALTLLSAQTPLLFMGDEYGERAAFLPFSNQNEEAFLHSKLNHALKHIGTHHLIWNLHQLLLQLRKKLIAGGVLSQDFLDITARERSDLFTMCYDNGEGSAVLFVNFTEEKRRLLQPPTKADMSFALSTSSTEWGGFSLIHYQKALLSGEHGLLLLEPNSAVFYSSFI